MDTKEETQGADPIVVIAGRGEPDCTSSSAPLTCLAPARLCIAPLATLAWFSLLESRSHLA